MNHFQRMAALCPRTFVSTHFSELFQISNIVDNTPTCAFFTCNVMAGQNTVEEAAEAPQDVVYLYKCAAA